MAAPRPTSRTEVPPPELPYMSDVSNTLTGYLRNFSLWCRQGFADKVSGTIANPGILLQACDAPSGTTPAVFQIQVKTDGTIIATPMSLGTGYP